MDIGDGNNDITIIITIIVISYNHNYNTYNLVPSERYGIINYCMPRRLSAGQAALL